MLKQMSLTLTEITRICVGFRNGTSVGWNLPRNSNLTQPPSRAKETTMEKETFNFGKALELLKEGKKVCRSGWNGKGMFLTLQEGSIVKGNMMRNKPAKDFYGDGEVKICPHIDMKAADGSYVVGWLASQTDMLADDWMEA